MVDLSIHPNWARSSSSRRSMAYTIITFGEPHDYSGPTVAREAFKLRAEIVERSFAHNLDRGGLRRA